MRKPAHEVLTDVTDVRFYELEALFPGGYYTKTPAEYWVDIFGSEQRYFAPVKGRLVVRPEWVHASLVKDVLSCSREAYPWWFLPEIRNPCIWYLGKVKSWTPRSQKPSLLQNPDAGCTLHQYCYDCGFLNRVLLVHGPRLKWWDEFGHILTLQKRYAICEGCYQKFKGSITMCESEYKGLLSQTGTGQLTLT